jgi:hypothetical protein
MDDMLEMQLGQAHSGDNKQRRTKKMYGQTNKPRKHSFLYYQSHIYYLMMIP